MKKTLTLLLIAVIILLPEVGMARNVNPADIAVPDGFQIEKVVDNLAAPTTVAFDDSGRMLIVESGYDGSGGAQVIRIENDGQKTVLANTDKFGTEIPATSISFYQGKIYVVHAGTVSTIDKDGNFKDIITGLPGQGDHQANSLVFKGSKLYLSIGTVTNSAVVGNDNAVFGWLKNSKLQKLHDVPCKDITLNTQVFQTDNAIGSSPPQVQTSPYSAYGDTSTSGQTVHGNIKCNGAILTANLDGSNLSLYAWGFRNPYGMQVGPDGNIYVSMHGFDARGSRPIENAWDCFYKVTQGAWYGWPDFACDVPVTDPQFKTQGKPQPQFLIKNHPNEAPPKPIVKFNPHSATNGFDFAPNDTWGKNTDVFLALFGDFTPATGTVDQPQGVKIVKLDTTNGSVTDFIVNKVPGQASRHSAGGLEHPSAVTFGPDNAMYIADWGIARVSTDGLKLDQNSGVIWKVTKISTQPATAGTTKNAEPSKGIGGPSLVTLIIIGIILSILTVVAAWGNNARTISYGAGLGYGFISGLIMGLIAMFVVDPIIRLPWHAAPRVFATLVMGRSALANILEFHAGPTIVGVLVLLILTSLLGLLFAWMLRTRKSSRIILAGLMFGLAIWLWLQYVIFPAIDPLITEKGYTPGWYALSFAIYGIILGWLSTFRNKIFTR